LLLSVEKLKTQGYVHKVESERELPQLWVTPKFLRLDFDTKKALCSAVCAFVHEIPERGKGDPLRHSLALHHSISGKKIGSFNPALGLQID